MSQASMKPMPMRARYALVAVPIPLLALLAILPWGAPLLITRWRRRRTAARKEAGFCPTCGYDLRASPARCPECRTDL